MCMKWLSAGMTIDDILADDEDLEREDIFSVIEFATQLSTASSLPLHEIPLEFWPLENDTKITTIKVAKMILTRAISL